MNLEELHAQVAKLYANGVKAGGEEASRLRREIVRLLPIPEPWWSQFVVIGLMYAEDGRSPEISPDEFADYERLSKRKERTIRMQRRIFEFDRGPDQGRIKLRAIEEALWSLFRVAALADPYSFDHDLIPLVDSLLSSALRYEPEFRCPSVDGFGLEELISRTKCANCLPRSERFAEALHRLQRVTPPSN